MTDEEILQKAIEKAENNGYKNPIENFEWNKIKIYSGDLTIDNGEHYDDNWTYSVQQIIFSHDFAKAFFGEEVLEYGSDGEEKIVKLGWQVHLKRMVLLPDNERLKYLEKVVINE